MAKILLLYSTTDGHTIQICDRIKRVLEGEGNTVELRDLKVEPDLQQGTFDKVVIGASIRYGKHQPLVNDFIKRNQPILEAHPNAFFSVKVVARKPEKNTPETNPYLMKFLKKIDWQQQHLGVFAGRIDYPSLGFFDKSMIRFILWMGKGPTDPTGTFEFTDWDRVEEFGLAVSRLST
mgnify:FL=1